jgi:2',3'-cyclic-nucleotide 2'-phosphodiesterase (5'-nucleotidase family)
MKANFLWLIITSTTLFSSCAGTRGLSKDDGKIELVLVQVNDVYEIAPLEGGKTGGMARVATLKKKYKAANPNTYLLMAGDFLSPSLYNSLQFQGKRIRGKQMVETMNAAGVDLVVFGNHEFDINESELQERINESAFQWVSSNTFQVGNGVTTPFRKSNNNGNTDIPTRYFLSIQDADGTKARIGFIGLTLAATRTPFVTYTDPLATAKKIYNEIKDSCDAVVALTHQSLPDDLKLAEEIPGLAVIIGGHEHNMQFHKRGNIYITKAHSNARSAYVVTLRLNKKTKTVDVQPEIKYITDSISSDPLTDSIVNKWARIGERNYDSLGFAPAKVVISSGEPLEGRETETRNRSTNLTDLVVKGMAYAAPQADVVIFNAGSIRVDDILQMPVTQYDILRTLPFGGGIREADMNGRLLKRVLNAGTANRNTGGFLHYGPVIYDSTSQTWNLTGKPITDETIYRVAMSDYLFAGLEQNLAFLNANNPDIVKVYEAETSPLNVKSDIRLAIIRYLESR